jgi:hypothetical protein
LIYEILETEDKCIGVFFVKDTVISLDEFRNKILFYLWNDILRDELPETKLRVFPNKSLDDLQSDYPVVPQVEMEFCTVKISDIHL